MMRNENNSRHNVLYNSGLCGRANNDFGGYGRWRLMKEKDSFIYGRKGKTMKGSGNYD